MKRKSKLRRRNMLRFRDFEIDEDDYHVLNDMLTTLGNLRDDADVRTVHSAIKKGAVEIGKENNEEKRVTKFSIQGFRKGRIPNSIEELDGLRAIEYTKWDELVCFPEGVWKLCNLSILRLNYCSNLQNLPEEISQLKNLRTLVLWMCYKITSIPKSIDALANLKALKANLPCLENLPVGLGEMISLEVLDLGFTHSLKEIPDSIARLTNLKELNLLSNGSAKFPPSLREMACLEKLTINRELALQTSESLTNLLNLKYLQLDNDSYDDMKIEFTETLNDLISNHSVLEELHINLLDFVHFKQDAFSASKTLTRLLLTFWVKNNEANFLTPMNFPIVPYLEKLDICVFYTPTKKDVDDPLIFLGPWLSLQRRLQELNIGVNSFDKHCISGKIIVSLSDVKHIKSLNVISLEGCRLDDGLQRPEANDTEIDFPSLREIKIVNCSGVINFAHLDFPNLEDLCIQQNFWRREEATAEGRMESIIIDCLGRCPKLKTLKIISDQGLVVRFSARSFGLFPALQSLSIDGCKIEFVGTSPSSTQEQEERLTLPAIEIIDFHACEMSPEASAGIFRDLDMPALRRFSYRSDDQLATNTFENLAGSFLPNSPSVTSLSFEGCGIAEIPFSVISSAPSGLMELNLSGNPIFESKSGRKGLLDLLRQCSVLGHVGTFAGEKDGSLSHKAEIGHLMSLNRARWRTIAQRNVVLPLALWPEVLFDAAAAFQKRNWLNRVDWIDDGFAAIEKETDAIFSLLREAAAGELLSALQER